MNLYKINANECEYNVVATSFCDAIKLWTRQSCTHSEDEIESITLVAIELIIEGGQQ